MDTVEICGDFKAPKFLICEKCGKRNHRASECRKLQFMTIVYPSLSIYIYLYLSLYLSIASITESSGQQIVKDKHTVVAVGMYYKLYVLLYKYIYLFR